MEHQKRIAIFMLSFFVCFYVDENTAGVRSSFDGHPKTDKVLPEFPFKGMAVSPILFLPTNNVKLFASASSPHHRYGAPEIPSLIQFV
ncbi:MAG: hypothetical protein MJ066_00505 [Clostridia bacterium]|nr:hypothetical protein [Clostridia bacterium]